MKYSDKEAAERVVMKRFLRKMRVPFYNEAPTVQLENLVRLAKESMPPEESTKKWNELERWCDQCIEVATKLNDAIWLKFAKTLRKKLDALNMGNFDTPFFHYNEVEIQIINDVLKKQGESYEIDKEPKKDDIRDVESGTERA